jgi:titin
MRKLLRIVTALAMSLGGSLAISPVHADAAVAPSTPVAVTIGAVTATSIAFSWPAPADTGGSAITGYDILRNGVKIARTPARVYTLGGLAGSTTYAVTIKACNLIGCSSESPAATSITAPPPATALRLTPGSTSVSVTWANPSTASGVEDSVWYRQSTSSTWIEWTPGVTDAPGTAITGLTNGVTYAIRVRTTASYGVTDAAFVLGTPMAPPAAVSLTYSNLSASGLILNWTTPTSAGAAPSTYEVYRDGVKLNTVTTKFYAANSLTPLQEYSFTVKSCNVAGCSEASAPLVVTLPPPPPSRLTATALPYKAALSWLDSPVAEHHSIWFKLATSTTWVEYTPGTPDVSPVEVTDLVGGATYNFRVGAHGAAGLASYTAISTLVVFGPPATPLKPRQSATAETSATIAWTTPFNGGIPLSGYKVFVDGSLVSEPSAVATSVQLTGLTQGTKYDVTIQACNFVGCSNLSAALPTYTTPAAPTGLSVAPAAGAATLTWTDSTSTEVTGYKIFFRVAGRAAWTEHTPTANDVSGTVIGGLTVLTSYETYVRSYNLRGFADTPVTSFSTLNYQSPSAPLAPSASPLTASTRVTWSAPASNGGAAVSDYVVQYSSDSGATWSTFARAASTVTAATITGLSSANSYVFRVAAKNIAGTSSYSVATSAVTPFAVAGAPLNVAGSAQNAQVVVSWEAPVSNGGSVVTDYVVQYSSNGGAYWATFSDGTSSATTVTVRGLTNGTNYVFRVAAVNEAGTGVYSAVSSAVTPLTGPGLPTKLLGTPANGQVRLSWSVPGSTGGSPIIDYVIQYSSDSGATWGGFTDTLSTATSAVISGLQNGTSYVFQVAAVTSFTTGSYSTSSASITPRTTPGAPTNASATAGNATVTLTWEAPVSNGGDPISDYLIQYSSNAGSSWTTYPDGISTATTLTLPKLTNGSGYTFRVAAVNGAGAGTNSTPSVAVTPKTNPAVPVTLVAASGDASAVLTWKAPSTNGGSVITDYVVQFSPADPVVWQTFDDGISSALTATVTGLSNGSSYVFRVLATNAVGSSAYTSATSVLLISAAPDAPTAVSATAGASTASLTWTAPEDTGGSAIIDYLIQYSSTGGNSWSSYGDGTSTAASATLGGLTNGVSYIFRVAAVTSFGAGAYSTPSSAVTPMTVPGAPSSVSGTYGIDSVALTWNSPVSNGGATISEYVIQYSVMNSNTWTVFERSVSTSTSALVTGLTNGTSYIFRVAAKNTIGQGAYSASSLAVTPRATADAPTDLVGTYGDTTVDLTWVAPADNGGVTITDYAVQHSSDNGISWTSFAHAISTDTNLTVTGLSNGTSYVFRVAAVNAVGAGSYSDTSAAVTPRTIPGTPSALNASYGDASATLTWSAPTSGGAAITDYVIELSQDNGATWNEFSHAASSATSATVAELTNGTSYVFRVAAINSEGAGAFSTQSVAVTPRAVPSAPSALTATAGNQAVTLAWIAPASNGATLTDYLVQYSSNSGSSWTTFADGVSASISVNVTGLTNGTSYVFRVAAVNSVGTGAFSGTSVSITPLTLPGAPTSVVGTYGDASVALTWNAPASNGGASITDYDVQVSSTNGASWISFAHSASADRSITVTGLTNGTSYIFRLAATTSVGTGSYSAASTAVTPRVTAAAPTAVTGAAGNTTVALTWVAPSANGGASITDYVIQVSSDAGSSWNVFSDATSALASALVTGLTNGTNYTFRVAAVNNVGVGAYSNASASVTPFTIPGAPSNVAGTAGSGSVALSWDAPVSDGGALISDYTVQYSSNSGTTWTTFSRAASATTALTVTGLSAGVGYVFRIAAINSAGSGAYSATSSSVTPVSTLNPPAGLVGSAGVASVALTWAAPVGATGITDYDIQYSSDSGASWTSFAHTASPATNRTVTGLTNATSYIFRAATANAVGLGSYSAASAAVTTFALAGAPTALAGTAANAQVALTWSAPASNGSTVVTDYVVQFSSDSGTTWSTFADGVSTSASATVTGLTNGTSYTFQVAATNAVGTGTYSSSSAALTPRTTPTTPTAVSGTFGDSSVSLTWSAPASNGGSEITDYMIQSSSDGGSTWTTFADGTSTAASTTVTGLTNGTAYTFRVAAMNAVGNSSYSTASTAVTPRATPGAPAAVAGVAGNTSASLTWSAPASNGAAITDYSIQYSSNAGSTWVAFSDGTSSSTSAIVTGLTNGTSYTFRVAATNSVGTSAYSAASSAVTPATAPSAPTALTGFTANAQAPLMWAVPASDGGSAITDYVIQFSSDSGTTWTTFADGTSTSQSAIVTGLTNGTSYIFRVAAANAAGNSSYSTASPAVTPRTTPGAPTTVAGAVADGQAPLTWSAPASNGGAAISDYVVQYSSNSGSSWTTFTDGISVATSTTVTGLTNGTSYVFRVAASNSAGTGSYSSPTATVTPLAAPGAPSITDATATASAGTFTFSAPASNGGTAVTGYTATCTSTNGGTTRTATGASSPLTVSSLDAGKSYTCSVTATTAYATGTASNAKTLTASWNDTSYYSCNAGDSLNTDTQCKHWNPSQQWVTSGYTAYYDTTWDAIADWWNGVFYCTTGAEFNFDANWAGFCRHYYPVDTSGYVDNSYWSYYNATHVSRGDWNNLVVS